jgi:tRNA threonylcarbamoyladenosine biosynthesis protein TsaE
LALTRETASREATQALGSALGSVLQPGAVVALVGDLGAGKTTFTQGVCFGLSVSDPVASPTFVLLRVYRGRLPVYHFDAYRLSDAAEMEGIGAEEYLWGEGVCLVEWADKVMSVLPPDHLLVNFETLSESARRISFVATGSAHQAMLDMLAS